MQQFPIEGLNATGSTMSARIVCNPYSKIPPSLRYGIGIEFNEIIPGKGPLSIYLDGISLPEKDWQKFAGPYRPQKRWEGGSVYVDSAHNPVDVHSIEFSNREGADFNVKAEFYIDFEFEGVPYENIGLMLDFKTKFNGLIFREPNWTYPETVKYPAEWRIPSEYTQESVDELVSRFAGLEGYIKKFENGTFRYIPRV